MNRQRIEYVEFGIRKKEYRKHKKTIKNYFKHLLKIEETLTEISTKPIQFKDEV